MKNINLKILGILTVGIALAIFLFSHARAGVELRTLWAELPEASGDLYIVSIGIDKYKNYSKSLFDLDAAVSDAKIITESIISSYKKLRGAEERKINNFLLLDENATKKNIQDALKKVAKESRPNDYFIFYFAGISDSKGQEGTQERESIFLTYSDKKVATNKDTWTEFLSLVGLKNWFETIQAKKQLIITEACNSKTFALEFAGILTENNPDIGALTGRNRVLIHPRGPAVEVELGEGENRRLGAPLVYFLTRLSKTNIFHLFSEDKRDSVVYELTKLDIESEVHKGLYSSSLYSEVFFEQDFHQFVQRSKSLNQQNLPNRRIMPC